MASFSTASTGRGEGPKKGILRTPGRSSSNDGRRAQTGEEGKTEKKIRSFTVLTGNKLRPTASSQSGENPGVSAQSREKYKRDQREKARRTGRHVEGLGPPKLKGKKKAKPRGQGKGKSRGLSMSSGASSSSTNLFTSPGAGASSSNFSLASPDDNLGLNFLNVSISPKSPPHKRGRLQTPSRSSPGQDSRQMHELLSPGNSGGRKRRTKRRRGYRGKSPKKRRTKSLFKKKRTKKRRRIKTKRRRRRGRRSTKRR
tara:strand:+ start:1247 stop:2014 length:768 start_codon:yes stop_codon:yes gene_type:complete